MKMIKALLVTSGLLVASMSASAQGMGGMGGMAGMGGMGLGPGVSCAKPDPACDERRKAQRELREHAVALCQDEVGPDRRRCIRDVRMSGQDCAKAPQPERCAAMKTAFADCKDKFGPDRRTCMADRMPAPDCAKAADRTRCEARVAATAACKDQLAGPDRRRCIAEKAAAKKPAN